MLLDDDMVGLYFYGPTLAFFVARSARELIETCDGVGGALLASHNFLGERCHMVLHVCYLLDIRWLV